MIRALAVGLLLLVLACFAAGYRRHSAWEDLPYAAGAYREPTLDERAMP